MNMGAVTIQMLLIQLESREYENVIAISLKITLCNCPFFHKTKKNRKYDISGSTYLPVQKPSRLTLNRLLANKPPDPAVSRW